MTVRDETMRDAWFLERLARIEKTIHAAPNAEREAMNRAVIAIGCRNAALRGAAIRRMGVPHSAIGLSLRDADFRRTQGVQVVGIELSDGTLLCPPDVARPLTGEETLLTLQAVPSEEIHQS